MKTELYFLLVILSGVAVITFFIFKPFIYALVLAMIFATVFDPIYKKALGITRGRNASAALVATLSVLIVVIVPLTFLGVQISQEATQLYYSLTENGGTVDLSLRANDALRWITKFSPVPIEFSFDINTYAASGLSWLFQHLGQFFASFAKLIASAFIFLIALYYLFKDGRAFKSAVVALSPLQDIRDEMIFSKLAAAIRSVVKGSLAVAFIQGIATTIGLMLFGVPNAALWGSVAAIAALVPGIGTAAVILPAILYLYFNGEVISAAGLLVWGVTAVGLVDNFLGPKLVGRESQLHPFLILLSILGGIAIFGPLGFLLGPLVLSLLFALLEIYSSVIGKVNYGK